jgi:hypothetical protein
VAVVVILCGLNMNDGQDHSVETYRQTADRWVARESLYELEHNDLHGFLYLPHAAVVYVPFAQFPLDLAETLSRLACLSLFLLGLSRILKVAGGLWSIELFPIVTLLAVPMALSALRNGQMTLPMAGLMMLAAADLAGWGCRDQAFGHRDAFAHRPVAPTDVVAGARCAYRSGNRAVLDRASILCDRSVSGFRLEDGQGE